MDCFKIEGRYKDSNYVALTTKAYRKAIDEACAGLALSITEKEEQALEQVYSRGLGPYFISGTNHQKVVQGRAPRHRGVKVGEITRVHKNAVDVAIMHELKRGDGLVFDAANWRSPEETEEGGKVYDVQFLNKGQVRLEFANNSINFTRIRKGDWVWRTYDAVVDTLVKPFLDAKKPVYTRPISFKVEAKQGVPLLITATIDAGLGATVVGKKDLEPATKRALDETLLREQLGRLGGTAFHMGELELDCTETLFVPMSELNALRRELVDQLITLRKQRPAQTIQKILHKQVSPAASNGSPAFRQTAKTHVLVRTPEQLEAALECKPDSITLDYLELYGLKPSVQKVKGADIHVRVASPRILKPTEQNILKFLQSLDCEILLRSGGLLYDIQQFSEDERPGVSGDFSLNAANALTGQTFLEMGLKSITPTHDLNAQQIIDLTKQIDATKIEIIAYQHLAVFHTEHCVFCRFLSEGTDYTNCGHPCEKHKVALKDKQGRLHPVMADVGCRNTVFGAEAQSAARHLQAFLDAGIANYRLEFVHETAEQVQEVTIAFQKALKREMRFEKLEGILNKLSPGGTTEGSLFVPQDFSDLPQLL